MNCLSRSDCFLMLYRLTERIDLVGWLMCTLVYMLVLILYKHFGSLLSCFDQVKPIGQVAGIYYLLFD